MEIRDLNLHTVFFHILIRSPVYHRHFFIHTSIPSFIPFLPFIPWYPFSSEQQWRFLLSCPSSSAVSGSESHAMHVSILYKKLLASFLREEKNHLSHKSIYRAQGSYHHGHTLRLYNQQHGYSQPNINHELSQAAILTSSSMAHNITSTQLHFFSVSAYQLHQRPFFLPSFLGM